VHRMSKIQYVKNVLYLLYYLYILATVCQKNLLYSPYDAEACNEIALPIS